MPASPSIAHDPGTPGPAPDADAPSNDLQDHLLALLALNNAHHQALSLLDEVRLRTMLARAYFAARCGTADAFMISFDQQADYDSSNFQWFRARYPRFVYMDRIVVAPAARRRGLAARLYAELDRRALADGHELMTCEINLDPPNPGSDAFHAALGFQEVGRAEVPGGSKTVRYLSRRLTRGCAVA